MHARVKIVAALLATATLAAACGSGEDASPSGTASGGAGTGGVGGSGGSIDASTGGAAGSSGTGAAGAAVDAASDAVDDITTADASGFAEQPVNVPSGPLCDIPPSYVASGGDPTFINCAVEADRFSDRDPNQVPAKLRVVSWNVEFGKASATIQGQLATHPSLANADFLLLTEVARHTLVSNPESIDQARELAQALKLDYVFAVEWDRRELPAELGEHGVAILSKYPLGNVSQVRHTPLNDWYKEDKLYGGRISLGADALVGGKRMRFYVSHLCTRGIGGAGRALQGSETRADALLPGRPSLVAVGGDFNTWTCNPLISDCTKPPAAEQVVQEYLAQGFGDGTAGWNGISQLGEGFLPQRLDWLFYRGTTATPGSAANDAKGSDHYPIHTLLAPP